MQFCKLNLISWQGGTDMLDRKERGAYITVLTEIYQAEGPIKLSGAAWAQLMNCSRATAYRLLSRLVAMGKLIRTAAGYHNRRAMAEIAAYHARRLITKASRAVSKLRLSPQRFQRPMPHKKIDIKLTVVDRASPDLNAALDRFRRAIEERRARL